ncbi:inositol monophosphatase family protein [Neorhizobium sp. IRS_2294]|uniref:inositol monophosphatase family protein n=1 Tax=unclassified Neorhizobium TaxID=2629175 RepID=UPI003D2C6E59
MDAFPDNGIFGKKGGDVPGTSGRIWVIDPIDGTFNFVRDGQNWEVSIGLYQNRRPVFGVSHAPVRDLTLVGGDTVPTRRNGSPMKPLPAFDLSRASTGFSFHPTVSTADQLEAIRFISDDLGINFRLCGSATMSLIEVAMGETDGYLSLRGLDMGCHGRTPDPRQSRSRLHDRLGSH